MKILVTGVGGPTPRSFVSALRLYSRYKRYEFIATDINPLSVGLYQPHLFNKSYLIPRSSDPEYWDIIETIVKNEKIEAAVILPELEVLAWSKRALTHTLPCNVLLPDNAIASKLVDKALMTEILSSDNLVPASFSFGQEVLHNEQLFSLPFPFWVRSASGSSGLGSLLVKSPEDLRNWVNINPDVNQFLASTFLPGRNLACKMLYHDGQLLRAAVGERVNYIMAKVAPSGITGNTSFGRLLNEPGIFEVAKKALEIMFNATGAHKHGFFTVDLKEDSNGIPKVTEINVRHVAFTQCFAAAGANFAEDTIRLLDQDPTFDRNFKLYEFDKRLIFLRDVDGVPIIMKEDELLK